MLPRDPFGAAADCHAYLHVRVMAEKGGSGWVWWPCFTRNWATWRKS